MGAAKLPLSIFWSTDYMRYITMILPLLLLTASPKVQYCDVNAVVTENEVVKEEDTTEDKDLGLRETDGGEEKDDSTSQETVVIKPDVITDVTEESAWKTEDLSDTGYRGEMLEAYDDSHTGGYSQDTGTGTGGSVGTEDVVESSEVTELPAEIVEIKEEYIPFVDKIFRHVLWLMNRSGYETEEDIPLPFVHRSEVTTISSAALFAASMFAIFWFAYYRRKEKDEESEEKSKVQ